MEVRGFDVEWGVINGIYRKELSNHHKKPVYKKKGDEGTDTYIYFWEDPDEPLMTGWWIAPSVGGDVGFATSKNGNGKGIPPCNGWKVLETADGGGNMSKSNIIVVPLSTTTDKNECYIPRTDRARKERHRSRNSDSRSPSRVRMARSPPRKSSSRPRTRTPPQRKSFSILRPIVLGRSVSAQQGSHTDPKGKSEDGKGRLAPTKDGSSGKGKSRVPPRPANVEQSKKGNPVQLKSVPARETGPARSRSPPKRECSWSVKDVAAPKSMSSGKGAPSKGSTAEYSVDSELDGEREQDRGKHGPRPFVPTKSSKDNSSGVGKAMLPGALKGASVDKARMETAIEKNKRLEQELCCLRTEKSKVMLRLDNEILSRQEMVEDMANFVVNVEKQEAGGVINEHCAWQLMEKWQTNDGSHAVAGLSAAVMRAVTRAKVSFEKKRENRG